MLEDVEADANPRALLRAVMGVIIDLRKAAHHTTVPPTDNPDERDSGAEEKGEEEGEQAAVAKNAVQYLGYVEYGRIVEAE